MGYRYTGRRTEVLDGKPRTYGDELPDSIAELPHLQRLISRGIVTWFPDDEKPETDLEPAVTGSAPREERSPGPRARRRKEPAGA